MTDNEVISILSRTIKDRFPTAKNEKEQVSQDAEPPLFYIYVMNSSVTGHPGGKSKQIFKVAVKFYSASKENKECFEKAAILWEAFRIMTFKDKKIRGRNMEYKAVEGVLHFYLDVINTVIETEEYNKFGNLEVNVDAREK